jgi:hypothetical protein
MATTSPKFSLTIEDYLKGLAVASLSQPILVILTSFSAGHFDINWTEQWHLAVSSAAAYLIKNFFSGPKPPVSGNTGINGKVVAIVVLFSLLATLCKAQSIFRPLPTYKKPQVANRFARVTLPTDSLPALSTGKFQGFRFAGPDIAFALPDFSIYTGLGIDYVWAVADNTTGKWAYNYTVGPRVYGGANLGSPTVRAIGAVGIRATFFNGWLALGALYNLTLKKTQATIGNPAALIPGLN